MKRQNIITIVSPVIETWSNFKKMCEAKELPYHTLKMLKFPIKYKNYEIHKTEFK